MGEPGAASCGKIFRKTVSHRTRCGKLWQHFQKNCFSPNPLRQAAAIFSEKLFLTEPLRQAAATFSEKLFLTEPVAASCGSIFRKTVSHRTRCGKLRQDFQK